jgi:hypothetical protein
MSQIMPITGGHFCCIFVFGLVLMQSDYQTKRLPRKNSQKPERDAVPT